MKSGPMMIAAVFVIASAAIPAMAQQPSATPVTQLSMDTVPRLDADGIRKVQLLLKQKGFDPGRFDGIAGPITKTAVRTFQEKYGMKANGEIDNQVLFALGAVDLAGGND